MLLLNVVGIIAYRTKVVDKNGGRQFSNFVLEIVTPVLVVNAYADVEYESRLVVNMLWTFLLAVCPVTVPDSRFETYTTPTTAVCVPSRRLRDRTSV